MYVSIFFFNSFPDIVLKKYFDKKKMFMAPEYFVFIGRQLLEMNLQSYRLCLFTYTNTKKIIKNKGGKKNK